MSKYLNISKKIDSPEKAKLFEEAVEILKKLDLDGDTAEVMLHEVGNLNELFDFLMGQERYLTARKVWDDIYNNDTLTYDNFDDYFNEEFLKYL
jgi:hypothetical protein